MSEQNHINVPDTKDLGGKQGKYGTTEQPKGGSPLQPVLDPVGKGLGTVLSPVGAVVSGITKPLTSVVGSVTKPALGPVVGTHEEKAEVLGGGNKDSYEHGKDSLGGRLQTGDNPLGLDQTGKFGFRDEK